MITEQALTWSMLLMTVVGAFGGYVMGVNEEGRRWRRTFDQMGEWYAGDSDIAAQMEADGWKRP